MKKKYYSIVQLNLSPWKREFYIIKSCVATPLLQLLCVWIWWIKANNLHLKPIVCFCIFLIQTFCQYPHLFGPNIGFIASLSDGSFATDALACLCEYFFFYLNGVLLHIYHRIITTPLCKGPRISVLISSNVSGTIADQKQWYSVWAEESTVMERVHGRQILRWRRAKNFMASRHMTWNYCIQL